MNLGQLSHRNSPHLQNQNLTILFGWRISYLVTEVSPLPWKKKIMQRCMFQISSKIYCTPLYKSETERFWVYKIIESVDSLYTTYNLTITKPTNNLSPAPLTSTGCQIIYIYIYIYNPHWFNEDKQQKKNSNRYFHIASNLIDMSNFKRYVEQPPFFLFPSRWKKRCSQQSWENMSKMNPDDSMAFMALICTSMSEAKSIVTSKRMACPILKKR